MYFIARTQVLGTIKKMINGEEDLSKNWGKTWEGYKNEENVMPLKFELQSLFWFLLSESDIPFVAARGGIWMRQNKMCFLLKKVFMKIIEQTFYARVSDI